MAFGRAFPIAAHTALRYLLDVPAQPPVPSGTFVRALHGRNDGPAAVGRGVPQGAHTALHWQLAAPIQQPLATATIIRAIHGRNEAGYQRQIPNPPLLAPPIIPRRVGISTAKVSLQAVKAGQFAFAERLNPFRAHVPLAIIARGPPRGPARVVSQAVRATDRTYVYRPRPHLAQPVLSQRQPVPAGKFVTQALARTSSELLGRTQQFRPHVAQPVVSLLTAAPPAKIVSQAVPQSWERQTPGWGLPFAAKHGKPLTLNVPFAAGVFVSQAAQARAKVGRGAPSFTVQYLATQGPNAPAYIVGVARPNALIGRRAPAPHLAAIPLLLGPPIQTVVVSAAVKNSAELQLRFAPPRPHLAGPILAPRPNVVVPIVTDVSVHRAYLRTPPLRPSTAPPIVVPQVFAYIPSLTVFHALEWPKPLRQPVPVHHGGPVTTAPVQHIAPIPFVAAPPFIGNARRGINPPHLAKPVLAQAGPGATNISQARQRALLGRNPRTLRLAPPITVPAGAGQRIVSQALQRAYLGRSAPLHTKLAAPVVTPPQRPFANARIVTARIPSVANRVVPAHLPPRTLSTSGPGATIRLQAVQRTTDRLYRDTVPGAKVAKPVLSQPPAGATIKLQAQARQLIRRNGHVLLPPQSPPKTVQPGTFVSQSLKRPYVGRAVTQVARVARPIVNPAPPPLPAQRVYTQALTAPYIGRRSNRPYLTAPAVLTGRTPVQTGTFQSQAERRPFFRRATPTPHLAAPIVTPPHAPFPPGTFVSQRLENLLRPRVGHVFHAGPIVGALVQNISLPGVIAPISTPGVISPKELGGLA